MSLPNTDSLTTGFPLVIPTTTQQPTTARLVLRNDRGQVVQQWLVKHNKCTLGSASSCGLRCDLPGIAPYHALLVIGARQVFIRALAPKLTRNNRPFNEILLTDEESHFEIAGHRFELSRKRDAANTAGTAARGKPERLKFTLARPFELNGRKAAVTNVVADSTAPYQFVPLNSASLDSRWVAQLIQSAIEPLESQLSNLLQPLNELQSESRKQRRLRKKRQSSRQRSTQHNSVESAALPDAAPQISQQVEDLVVKHSAAMDVLTERIADVNQQLSVIERIIAAEREETKVDNALAENPHLAQQSQAIEQLQNGIVSVTTVLQRLQTQQSQEWDHDLEWKSNIQEQLAGVTQVVDSLAASVSEMHALASRQGTPEQLEQDRREEQQWKVEVQQRLAGLCQVVDSLSLNVSDIHTTALADATPEKIQQHEDEQRWKTEVKQQLIGMSEVIASLSSSVAEVHRSATAEPTADELRLAQQQRYEELEWKSSVQQQLSSLRQVVNGVSANLTQLQTTAEQESAQRQLTLTQAEDPAWQSELRLQVAEMRQVIDGLSANVAEIHTTALQDEVQRHSAQSPAADQEWQSEFRQQLGDLSQVIDSLSANMAEMYSTALNEHVSRQSAPAPDSDWQLEVRQQLAGLTQVVDALSATVSEVHQIAISEAKPPAAAILAAPEQRPSEFWEVSDTGGTSGPANAADAHNLDEYSESNYADEADHVETTQSVCKLSASKSAYEELENHTGLYPEEELDVENQLDVEEGLDPDAGLRLELAEVPELTWPDPMPAASPQQALWELPVNRDSQDEFLFGGGTLAAANSRDLMDDSTLPGAAERGETRETMDRLTTMSAGPDVPAREAAWTGPSDASYDTSVDAESEDTSSNWEMPSFVAEETSQRDDLPTGLVEQRDAGLPSWWRDEEEQSADDRSSVGQSIVDDSDDSLESHHINLVGGDIEIHDEPSELPANEGELFEADAEEFYGLNQYEAALTLGEDPAETDVAVQATWGHESTDLAASSAFAPSDDVTDETWSAQDEAAEEDFPNPPQSDVDNSADAANGLHATDLQESGEEDDSVEDYMRKLLARMRGAPEEDEPAPAKPVPVQPRQVSSERMTPPSSVDTASNNSSAPRTTVASPQTAVDSLEVTEPFDPEKYMPRALAPERSQSLAAMRELANSSARTAIHRSTRQRHVSSIVLKTVIATVGLTVGMVLVAINGLNVNVGLVATVASFLVAAIWGYDSLTSIRPMLQAGLILRPEGNSRQAPADKASEAKED